MTSTSIGPASLRLFPPMQPPHCGERSMHHAARFPVLIGVLSALSVGVVGRANWGFRTSTSGSGCPGSSGTASSSRSLRANEEPRKSWAMPPTRSCDRSDQLSCEVPPDLGSSDPALFSWGGGAWRSGQSVRVLLRKFLLYRIHHYTILFR